MYIIDLESENSAEFSAAKFSDLEIYKQFECLIGFFKEAGSGVDIDGQSSLDEIEEPSFPEE